MTAAGDAQATPHHFLVKGTDWSADPGAPRRSLGPLGLIVTARDVGEMVAITNNLQGQLTCTLHLDEADTDLAHRLMPALARKSGRVLANGYPTGVEVCDAMVHGGPYPASTNSRATSVGTMAIRRFLRPVCYQNLPDALLCNDLV